MTTTTDRLDKFRVKLSWFKIEYSDTQGTLSEFINTEKTGKNRKKKKGVTKTIHKFTN